MVKSSDHNPPRLPSHLDSEWLGVTLHSIGDGVVATGQDGTVTFLNPVAESLLGWESHEAVGQPVGELFRIIHEETRRSVESPVTCALREGHIAELSNHILLLAKDGTERPISDSAAPIRDRNGHIVGAVLVFRDMTAQREREREVTKAREYAENILGTLRHPFLVLDRDLYVISANRSFYTVFRVDPETTTGKRVYDLGNGQWDIPRLRSLLEETLHENSSFDGFEVEHEFPQIGHRYMLLNARRIRREGEHDDLILLGIEDTTERRELEEERRKIETRFTSLVKNIKDHAIFTLDLEGRIATWNLEAERILGWREEEAVGQDFAIIFTAEDKNNGRPKEELKLATKNGRAEDERWHCRQNGQHFWALGIVTPLHNGAGEHIGFSKILRDITDRKRAYDSLKDADRHKNEFLALLGHELRNPLAPICTGLEVLRAEADDPVRVEEICGLLQRQTEQLKTLVDDLVDVSRISRGKLELRKRRVRLADVVSLAVEASQDLIDEAQHELVVDLPEQPVVVDADPNRLSQMISNLLNNAAKYTPPGGHISFAAKPNGPNVVVTVKDSGVGIPAELRENIFEMFTQGNSPQARAGLGIGLALVKSLVEMHGGEIQIESDGADQGTTASVRLPIVVEGAAVKLETDPPADASGLRVLVVDDNVAAADMLGILLRKLGNEVSIAYDGAAAIKAASEFAPNVVVMDIGMPEIDGNDAARSIRQLPAGKSMTLIALTGWGQEEDKRRTKEAGFDHHLVKPPESAELRWILSEVHSRSS